MDAGKPGLECEEDKAVVAACIVENKISKH